MNKTWLQPSKVPRVEKKCTTMISRLCRRSWESGSRMLLFPLAGGEGVVREEGVGDELARDHFIAKDRNIQRSSNEGFTGMMLSMVVQGLLRARTPGEGACGTEIQQC